MIFFFSTLLEAIDTQELGSFLIEYSDISNSFQYPKRIIFYTFHSKILSHSLDLACPVVLNFLVFVARILKQKMLTTVAYNSSWCL
jgi:hypothetical protein